MKKYLNIVMFVLMLSFLVNSSNARTKEQNKGKKQEGSKVLRAASGIFDLQKNKVSRIELHSTNYGLIGHDFVNGVGGGVWPRGQQNQYIFGGGIWFAAKKIVRGDTMPLCVISYNPNSANSWLSPGMIDDGDAFQSALRDKYRVYFSTDFNPTEGTPNDPNDGPNWPIWDNSANLEDSLSKDRYVGNYVDDINLRNVKSNSKGPAFISQEDIFSVFKDTDLSRYEGGVETRRAEGYPMRLQFEQMIYSWGFGDYRDFMFIKYIVINKSTDTLYDCWAASAYDMDIAPTTNVNNGAQNDRTRYYNEVDSLNLAVQWTQTDQGEAGKGFGYIGFDFLESPAVDANRNIRHDSKFYTTKQQLGLVTFKNWTIANDPLTNADRYNFMSSSDLDGDIGGGGDKRFLMATGPFNVRPNDTARITVGLIFAGTPNGGDATGVTADLINLVRVDTFAQAVYDNNYKAPKAPDPAQLSWRPLNNAMLVSWDSTSEISFDALEEGLDFLGYRLFRARRSDLDSFDVDQRAAPINKGPFGWKQIAEWKMDLPFLKSAITAGDVFGAPAYDSVRIIRQINRNSFLVGRFPNHASGANPFGINQWGEYFKSMTAQERKDILLGQIIVDTIGLANRPVWTDRNGVESYNEIKTWVAGVVVAPNDTMYLPWTPAPNGFTASDSIKYSNLMRSLLSLVKQGKAVFDFPNIESDSASRKKIRNNVIVPYMKSITNNNTFIDLGDDDRDGAIKEDVDPTLTEKLLNNVQYFYRLLAWDEGDFKQKTALKVNVGVSEKNQIAGAPNAAPAGDRTSSIKIISVDSSVMGGFYNFKFNVLDQDRFNQLFTNSSNEGHDLEIEFNPAWGLMAYPIPTTEAPNPPTWGLYQREITVRDKTTGNKLFTGTTYLEPVLGVPFIQNTGPELFTENAATYVGTDQLLVDSISGEQSSFGVFNDKGKRLRTGTFTTEKTNPNNTGYISLIDNEAKQTLGFSFDYGIQQQGGQLRIDTAYASNNANNASTVITYSSDIATQIQVAQRVDTVFDATGAGRIIFGSFNNGPAQYEIEFMPGGVDTLKVTFGTSPNIKTRDFIVNYLTMKARNNISYKRINELGDSVTVTYPVEVPLAVQPVVAPSYPLASEVPIGSYDLSAFGWVNSRTIITASARSRQTAGFLGQQGRYYLSAISADSTGKMDTLDFVHIFQASGAELGLDYANRGRRDRAFPLWDVKPDYTFGNDFLNGDKIQFNITGGALGFPLPGAKITAKVITSIPKLEEYTDNMMDQIKVVPNPYYVTNQVQRSPYDAKIFFTKLPKQCTISIYTVSGDLIKKFEHNEFTSPGPDKYAIEVWDLLSSNNQRVSSQTLIAKIETPNGANTIQKFSVVVGGFRIVPE